MNLGGVEKFKRKLMDEAKRDWVGWGLSSISTILMIKSVAHYQVFETSRLVIKEPLVLLLAGLVPT